MTQALKRALFGYEASAVRQILADRETMFERAVEDARNAESRLEAMTAELGAAREDARSIRSDLDEHKRQLENAVKRAADLDAEREDAVRRAASLDVEVERLRGNEREHGERVRLADTEIQGLRNELDALRRVVGERGAVIDKRDATIADLQEQVERLRSDVHASVAATDATTPASTPADLDRMLAQTGETITRMVEDARRTAERQLAETERRRDEVRAEIDRLETWRDRLVPLAHDVAALLSETETRTAEIDERLRSAVEPMTRAVASLRGRLADLIDQAAEVDTDGGAGSPGEEADDMEPAETGGDDAQVVHLSGDRPIHRWTGS